MFLGTGLADVFLRKRDKGYIRESSSLFEIRTSPQCSVPPDEFAEQKLTNTVS